MSNKRAKINNENSEIKEKERREMINNLSEMMNNISEDNNNDWLDKSCKIIKMLIDENETLKEESYGFKYISEEKHSGDNRIIGEEIISFAGNSCFSGNYDFALIKKNLEDKLN